LEKKPDAELLKDFSYIGVSGKIYFQFKAYVRKTPLGQKIDQSLCTSCDAEAVSLIGQGPKWKYTNGKRYLINI
jgi:hypothetical protein